MAPSNTMTTAMSTDATSEAAKYKPKWTVMIFMGADTVAGSEPLVDAVKNDLEEIRSVVVTKTLEIFVQVHRSAGGTRRHRFYLDPETQKATESEMEIPTLEGGQALVDFIASSVEQSGHRRDDHSMLVLWGHAYDFAFGRTRTRSGVVDAIDFVELSGTLQRLQDVMKERYRKAYGDQDDLRPTLDIVAFDVCDVATVEMACQLQPYAKYLLGSEIGVPIPGWPYDRILARLADPKDRLMTPDEFGSWAIRRFCEEYPASSPVSLSFLDLSQATDLRARAELLALALSVAIGNPDTRARISELFIRSQTAENRPYVDVADLCLNLVRESGDVLVAETARALGDLLLSPRVHRKGSASRPPFIVDHGRNAGELARMNGVSLYAPHVAVGDHDAVRGLYDEFVFAQNTVWSTLVYRLANSD